MDWYMEVWKRADPRDIVIAGLAAMLILIWASNLTNRFTRRKWGKTTMPMTRVQREKYRERCVCDILTDGLELYVAEGLLQRYDADVLYLKLGRAMKWKNILPREHSTMSEKIRRLLHRSRIWGYRKPEPPEVKPKKRSTGLKPA